MPATKAINHRGSAAAHDGGPGAAMRAVAQKLAAHGFDVRGPDWEDGRRLTVTNLPGTIFEVTVEDHGFVTWEYWRGARKGADPDRLAGLVMRLLTGDGAAVSRRGAVARTVMAGLPGIVGRELQAKGLEVCLDVYADHAAFEVAAEIVVTNPAHPGRGRVRVGDEAGLTWECGYRGGAGNDTGAIADTIVTIVGEDIADGYIQRAEPAPALACSGQRDR